MEKREEHVVEAEDDHDAISLLPGFRFHPTDEELVGFYLRRKVENVPPCLEIIKEIDIYQHDPWDLPMITAGTKEHLFFCLRGRKYRNSIRPNRVTRSGFWIATGIDRPIHSPADSGACIGLKKSLVYYTGFAGKGTKTEWAMHELRLPSAENNTASTVQEAEVWTICRIFKRSLVIKKQLHSFQLSSTHHKQKTAPWSSSVATSCFESANKDNEYSCSTTSSSCYPNGANGGGELRFIADYLFEQDQNGQVLHGGQIWDSIGQAPRMEPAPSVAQSPCVDELFKTSEWDELWRIEQFMADDSLSPLQ